MMMIHNIRNLSHDERLLKYVIYSSCRGIKLGDMTEVYKWLKGIKKGDTDRVIKSTHS